MLVLGCSNSCLHTWLRSPCTNLSPKKLVVAKGALSDSFV